MKTFMTNDPPEKSPSHSSRPRCLACKKRFTPEPRVGSRQKYCSNKECQSKRQHLNEQAWQKQDGNRKFKRAQQRRWRKRNPEYMQEWRKEHPESVRRNRKRMRKHMRQKRREVLFEKSKEWRSQVAEDKGVIYTNCDNTWILTRLKRASSLRKALSSGYACGRIRSELVRLPQGRLYKVSGRGP